MTTIITTGPNNPEPPAPVVAPVDNTAVEILADEVQENEQETDKLREDTAQAVALIGERLLDVEEVVAYLVNNVDDIVDYLEELHAEREAANPTAEPDIPVPEKASKKIERARDAAPKPKSRGRQIFLGRSGGIYP